MEKHYDIIIVGSGAGGSTIAYKLASTGKKILIIERGDYIPREKENWNEVEVFSKERYRQNVETWYDRNEEAFKAFTHYCVGGNTKFYGAALLRLRETDFREVKHVDGISPAWPIKYSDLEPYYTEAEYLYSVHGHRGSDPTEPLASREYPSPPLPMEEDMENLYYDFQQAGLNPFPCPIAVRMDENNRGVSRAVLSNFDGYPDMTKVKADAQTVALEEALKQPNVDLMVNCTVEKLITDMSGRHVTSVWVRVNGESEFISAGMVIVSCGAIQSAALMLRSANEKHPNGLANSSGMVGRNYMAHNNGALIVVSGKKNNSQFQKAFGITDFYHTSDHDGMPLGAIQLMGKSDKATLADLCKDVLPGLTPEEISTHSIDFWLTTEDLPDPENRVTLREDGSIKLTVNQKNRKAYELLKEKLKSLIRRLSVRNPEFTNAVFVGYDLGVSGVSHQNGTLRFGTDPVTSVLDINCKAHDVENLYVVDASFFPSCGAVNPSLTIMANALRVGDHIRKNVLKEELQKATVA
jgi:choline dehydrogenase-like flavoprotein